MTHIVTDAGVRNTLKALSLKSLSDIPDTIPTVTWDWVVSGYGRANKRKSKLLSGRADKRKSDAEDDSGDENDLFDFEFMHAAFPERIDAGCSWKSIRRSKQGGKPDPALQPDSAHDHSSGDISHISYVPNHALRRAISSALTSITVLFPRREGHLEPRGGVFLSPRYHRLHSTSRLSTVAKLMGTQF